MFQIFFDTFDLIVYLFRFPVYDRNTYEDLQRAREDTHAYGTLNSSDVTGNLHLLFYMYLPGYISVYMYVLCMYQVSIHYLK